MIIYSSVYQINYLKTMGYRLDEEYRSSSL